MPGRPRTVSDDDILDAAGRAIGRHGPRLMTLAHVAAEAGLAPATLVQRFGSKRGLLLAVAARGPEATETVFEAARAAERSPLAGLRRALSTLVAGVSDRSVLANNVAFLEIDLSDPEIGAHAQRQARVMRRRIRRFLVDAAEAGELAGADAGDLAVTVLAAYNGALITWALDGEGELVDWLGRRLDAVLAPYVRGPAATAATAGRRRPGRP